jgi:hypothetical protein
MPIWVGFQDGTPFVTSVFYFSQAEMAAFTGAGTTTATSSVGGA